MNFKIPFDEEIETVLNKIDCLQLIKICVCVGKLAIE